MSDSYELLVGVDWATQEHRVCLVTPDGAVAEECVVEHNAHAIHALLERLVQRVDGHPERIAVAIEAPRGALVETMVASGLHVYTLNPKQADRFRDRHTVAGAKDDRRDAYVLGDALRTDRPKFRRVELDHPLVLQIRELSRADDELRDDHVRLTHRLREQLYRCASHLLQLSPGLDEPWFWELVQHLFQEQPRRQLTRAQAAALLRHHRIRRLDADQVLQVVQQEPVPVAPGAVDATRRHVALLLPRLRLVHEQRKQCEKQLKELLQQYADVDEENAAGPSVVSILLSLPGVGTTVAATLLGKASQLLAAADHAALRALTGVAPVTIQSGKSHRGRRVVMRQACDASLRNACYHWARVSAQHDEHARAYYAAQRARGHNHGRALRSLADRWLRVLMAMLLTRTLYDPEFHSRRVPAAALST